MAPLRLWAVLLAVVAAAAPKATKGGSKACAHVGFYTKQIVPMCESHFPEVSSKNAWVVQFYHPRVGQVQLAKEGYEFFAHSGKELDGTKVGAVDCENNQAFCASQGIREVPTTRIISAGRSRDFTGEYTKEALLAWNSDSIKRFKEMDEALKCDLKGLFIDANKDSALPVCTSSFPPALEPVPWMVAFYETGDQNKDKTMRKTLNKIAEKYGNNPPKKVDAKNKKPLKMRVGAVDCVMKKGNLKNDCDKLGITTLPTVRFYSSWAEPKDFDSFFDGDELKQFVDAQLKEKPKPVKVDAVQADMPEESKKAKEDL
jgi:hypothetical protein